MKSQVYRQAAITGCVLAFFGLLVGCLDLRVSFENSNPDTSSTASTDVPQSENNIEVPIVEAKSTSKNVSIAEVIPASQVKPDTSKSESIFVYRQEAANNGKGQGTLRMSNQTDQPVRLALLARPSSAKGAAKGKKINYEVPAHWDFAPQEGSAQGLLLSLPNGNLKLEKGDILVAFAQDGSRRYWGPYVVGETSLPTWNSASKEWVLVLSQ